VALLQVSVRLEYSFAVARQSTVYVGGDSSGVVASRPSCDAVAIVLEHGHHACLMCVRESTFVATSDLAFGRVWGLLQGDHLALRGLATGCEHRKTRVSRVDSMHAAARRGGNQRHGN
jgi:hypothetical protein